MQNFKDLIVWQKAHNNVIEVYKLTDSFPKAEMFGITSQLRRAVISVPNNIVEGCGKFTQRDFAKYLQQALGSCQETEYLLLLSFELELIKESPYSRINKEVNEVKAMLISLIKKVRST